MNGTRNTVARAGQPHQRRHSLDDGSVKITTFVPLQFKKRGVKKVVVAPDGVADAVVVKLSRSAIGPNHDVPLLKAIGRGYFWQHLIDTGVVADAAEIAQREGIHKATITEAIRLTLLAPDIVHAALEGTLPRTMSLETLLRNALPLDWDKQREMIRALG